MHGVELNFIWRDKWEEYWRREEDGRKGKEERCFQIALSASFLCQSEKTETRKPQIIMHPFQLHNLDLEL